MGKSSIDINGYRRQEANPISMVGVFPYTGKQIDYDGSLRLDPHQIYWVLRPPEELFSPEAIKSFNGLPIRIGHVMLGTGFESVDKEPVDGCIYNVRQSMDMPEYLIGDFSIYTEKMKDVLDKGKIRELSLGYRCQYIPETGIYNGQPYEFKQANLRGNHLALVENGRCGSSVRVCDEAILTFDSLPEEMIEMKNNEKIEKAKVLADALRNSDVCTCEDCLDFITFAHDDRMEVLEALKAKKKGNKVEAEEKVEEKVEPTAEDGCGGKKKDSKAKDEIPPPPPPEEPAKKEEPVAPAAKAVAPAVEPKAEPPAAEPKAPAAAPAPAPEKAPVGAEPVKDSAPATVTTPSISAPVAKVAGPVEEKKEPKAEDKKDPLVEKDRFEEKIVEVAHDGCGGKKAEDCGGKKTEDGCECNKSEDGCCKKTEDGCGDKHAEDGCGKKTEDGGITKEPMGGKVPPMPEPKETFGESNTAMDGIAPDVFAKVAAECDRARKLALAVGQMGIAIDSAGKREIEVAREAVKQIPSLAFAVDAADDAILMAVRGAVAARADELARAKQSVVTLVDTPAVVQDSAIKAPTTRDIDRALEEYFRK